GDVVPERTMLVVDEKRGNYLPLFPLSIFHFQQNGQGLFFLNDVDWAGKADRLKKARYMAYDSSLGKYEARAGELVTNSLETKVGQMVNGLRARGISLQEVKAEAREAEDYNL